MSRPFAITNMSRDDRGDDAPASVLTSKQRRFLRGDEESTDSAGRAMRARIRERVHHGLLDFSLIFENLSDGDRQKVRDEAIHETPNHSLMARPTSAPADVAATLAFLCDLHEDLPHFERTIEHAVERVFWHRDTPVANVETSIDVDTGVDTETAIEKYEAGNMDALTDGERDWLVRALQATGDAPADRLREIPPGNRWSTGDAVARRRREGDE
jgi:hypothetical protein